MKHLIEAYHPPEPRIGDRNFQLLDNERLAAIDQSVHRDIKQCQPPQTKGSYRSNAKGSQTVQAGMCREWQLPTHRTVFAVRHPVRLQDEIGEVMLDLKSEHQRNEARDRNGHRSG